MAEDNAAEPDLKLSWRLPPEILALVFAELQRLWRADPTGPRGGLGMIEVSQVSRFWRSLALSESSLWCSGVEACNLPPRWTPVVIQRTGKHALDVHFSSMSNTYAMAALHHWFDYTVALRIRSLDITCEGYEASLYIVREMRMTLPPNLVHLHLRSALDPEPLYDDETTPKQELFKITPLLSAGQLKTADLTNFMLSWTPTLFSNVTHLKVVLDPYDDPDIYNHVRPPTHKALKETLESMTNLEELYLGDVYPTCRSRTPNASIALSPSCQSVTVQVLWSDEDCIAFLSSLVIPPTASVTFVAPEGTALLELVATYPHLTEQPRVARFTCASENEGAGAITFFPDVTLPLSTPVYTSGVPTSTRTITLRARLERDHLVEVFRYGMDPAKADEHRNMALLEFIEAISDSKRLRVDGLVHLYLHELDESTADPVRGLLCYAVNVRTLVLGRGAAGTALRILCSPSNESAGGAPVVDNGGEASLLPSLTEVVLDVQDSDLVEMKWFGHLIAFLEAHQAHGSGALKLWLPRAMAEQQRMLESVAQLCNLSFFDLQNQ